MNKYSVFSANEIAKELGYNTNYINNLAKRLGIDAVKLDNLKSNFFLFEDAEKLKAFTMANRNFKNNIIYCEIQYHFFHSRLNFVDDVDDL